MFSIVKRIAAFALIAAVLLLILGLAGAYVGAVEHNDRLVEYLNQAREERDFLARTLVNYRLESRNEVAAERQASLAVAMSAALEKGGEYYEGDWDRLRAMKWDLSNDRLP